jgi:hypothetical protein
MRAFSSFEFKTGLLYDYSDNQYPTRLYGLTDGHDMRLNAGSTYFVYCYKGIASINGAWSMDEGMYASVPGYHRDFTSHIRACTNSKLLVIERIGFEGVFSVGGPIEAKGRLRYIDGCTDSLLIPPVKKGDPCLNHLHFPSGINQTMHTHPSMRVGVVARGKGECVSPEGHTALVPGTVFIIHEDGEHCFRTFGASMDVIAYHPDSDFGPQDEDHPMVNRTIVNGVSAKEIEAIRTK